MPPGPRSELIFLRADNSHFSFLFLFVFFLNKTEIYTFYS